MMFKLILLFTFFTIINSQSNDVPRIKDVSAMCTINGITASIQFDRPFSGLIYSLGYERSHECMYYNSVLTESVLFSIPNGNCGTRKTNSPHEMMETLENRVYVQMDRFTQTASDKQFAFVCQQAYIAPTIIGRQSNEIRRHPGSVLQPNLGKPITPIVGGRYQIQNNWPIQNTHYGFDSQFQPSYEHQRGFQGYTTSTSQPASPLFSNSIVEPSNGAFAQKATTHAYGNRNSWSMFATSQPHDLDDFMPGTNLEHLTLGPLNDADLLQPKLFSPKYTSTTTPITTTKYLTSSIQPIIAPNPADSIDTYSETRLFANQQFEKISESVQLEIQKGQGPFNKSIDSAVKIGDLISLTVHGKASSKDESQFNMFVHTCFASDENSTVKINLIDSSGCAIHSQVLQPMQRLRKSGEIYYYFPLKAFKFPGPTEVFFYCSVEISQEHNFPQPCNNKSMIRKSRTIHDPNDEHWVNLNLSKNVTIQLPTAEEYQRIEGQSQSENQSEGEASIGNYTLIGGLLALLTLTIASTALTMIVVFKFRK